MTGVLLVACYLFALAFFLGLDIISKVPPTLYALVLAALGGVAAVSVVGGFHLLGPRLPGEVGTLGRVAVGAAAVAAVGAPVAIGRLLGAFRKPGARP